jgi:hypothetical protein
MMVARVLCLNRTALSSSSHDKLERLAARLAAGTPLNLENQVAAWRLVAAACRARLAEMPTSLEGDLELLAGASLDHEMRTCVRYRLARKRLLDTAARRLEAHAQASLAAGRVVATLGGPAL